MYYEYTQFVRILSYICTNILQRYVQYIATVNHYEKGQSITIGIHRFNYIGCILYLEDVIRFCILFNELVCIKPVYESMKVFRI